MKKESRFPNTHTTLEGEKLELQKLNKKEKKITRKFRKLYNTGINYLDFEQRWWNSTENLMAKNFKQKPIEQMAIYKYVNDLAMRLGITQRYLVKHEVVKKYARLQPPRREVNIDYIVKHLGCNRRFVKNAIHSCKLRARKVNNKCLIWMKDANAFIRHHKSKQNK